MASQGAFDSIRRCQNQILVFPEKLGQGHVGCGMDVAVAGMRSLMDDATAGDVYHSKPKKCSRTLVCAVDGSEGSNLAFHMMMAMKKRLDTVCLFHTYSLEKESSLPTHFRKDELRSYYENELLRTYQVPVGKFSFDWVDRRGHSVNEILVELLNEYKGIRNPMTPTRQAPNFFFCGYSGRKKSGSFHDSTEDEGNGLGSTANFASRNLHVPVVISKKALSDPNNPRCFVVGVDGTPLSKRGFHLLLQLVSPHDTVKSLYIDCINQNETHADFDPALFDDYRAEVSQMSPDIDFTFEALFCSDPSLIPSTICEYAHDHHADFISISPRATGDLSSISEQIILLAHCSVILTKS
jgi:nucleotide-binding universal stress UspA family protein